MCRRAGDNGVSFWMYAVSTSEVMSIADAELLMPPKVCHFYSSCEPFMRLSNHILDVGTLQASSLFYFNLVEWCWFNPTRLHGLSRS